MRATRTTRWGLLAPAALWLTILFLVPLLLVVAVSFSTRAQPFAWEFSTAGWADALHEKRWPIYGRTLWFSVGATGVCLLLGFPVAWFIVRRPPQIRQVMYALVLIPLVANSLVLVYAWKTLLAGDGLVGSWLVAWGWGPDGRGIHNTRWASLVGMVYYFLPFMVYPIYTSLEKMDWRLLEAAADLGAAPRQQFWHVTLPLVWPGIATGSILVFIQSIGTFVIPDLLAGNKDLFLGKLINDQFLGTARNWPLGAAMSLLAMGLISVALWLYFKIQARMEK
jgi:spermidine/putrescine transport system permease protein